LNGLILPITLGVVLIASRRKNIIGDYKHPTWMIVSGIAMVAVASYAGIMSLPRLMMLFQ
jgi:Mn2+/Fe2+ NRAMP family transporter